MLVFRGYGACSNGDWGFWLLGCFFRALAVGEWGRSFKLSAAGRRANGFFCGGGGRFGSFWHFSERVFYLKTMNQLTINQLYIFIFVNCVQWSKFC